LILFGVVVMNSVWIIISAVGGIIVGGIIGWLAGQKQSSAALHEKTSEYNQTTLTLNTELASLKATLEAISAEKASESDNAKNQISAINNELFELRDTSNERIQQLTAQRSSLETEVEQLEARLSEQTANWKEQFEAFLLTQGERLKTSLTEKAKADYTQNQEHLQTRINELLKPLNDTLKTYQTRVEEVDKAHYAQTTSLKNHMERLEQTSSRLANALSSNKGRGDWGEVQLIRLLEDSGLVKGTGYDTQVVLPNGKRPDVVIKLPEERVLFIDAKALQVNVEPQEELTSNSTAMLHSLKTAVKDLAGKQYQAQLTHAADFVVLYVPLESMLAIALSEDPTLSQWARRQGVMLASPLNMMAMLQLIQQMWQFHKLSEDAHQILSLGQQLYKQVSTSHSRLEKLGRAMQTVNNAYNEVYTSMAGNQGVFKRVKSLEAYGCDQGKPFADSTFYPEGALQNTKLLTEAAEEVTLTS
jgi:DNA recombination protein RmuC